LFHDSDSFQQAIKKTNGMVSLHLNFSTFASLLVLCCFIRSDAFSAGRSRKMINASSSFVTRQQHRIPSSSAGMMRTLTLKMNRDAESEAQRLKDQARKLKEEVAALSGTTVEEMEAKEKSTNAENTNTKKNGDLYDDEVAPYKDPISKEMRAKLMREASTGLDANQKQTNVILYISLAVVVLVLLAGQGILY